MSKAAVLAFVSLCGMSAQTPAKVDFGRDNGRFFESTAWNFTDLRSR